MISYDFPVTISNFSRLRNKCLGKCTSGIKGRVDIQWSGVKDSMGGTWHTICDDGFDANAAMVVCKMLGYNFGLVNYGHDAGYPHTKILLDDLKCTGNEGQLEIHHPTPHHSTPLHPTPVSSEI